MMKVLFGRKFDDVAPVRRKPVTRERLMEILGEDYLSPDNYITRRTEPNEFSGIAHKRGHSHRVI